MNEQTSDKQRNAAPRGYITLLARLWIDQGGDMVRGTLQDVHTGASVPIDLSGLIGFLRDSLDHTVGSGIDEPSPNE